MRIWGARKGPVYNLGQRDHYYWGLTHDTGCLFSLQEHEEPEHLSHAPTVGGAQKLTRFDSVSSYDWPLSRRHGAGSNVRPVQACAWQTVFKFFQDWLNMVAGQWGVLTCLELSQKSNSHLHLLLIKTALAEWFPYQFVWYKIIDACTGRHSAALFCLSC